VSSQEKWGQGLAHPFQAVGHGDEDVLTAARLQIGEDLHPEFGPFGLLDPDAENVTCAIGQDGQCEIDRFAADRGLVANLDAQRIEEDDRVTSARAAGFATPSLRPPRRR
jgi:hypothetical protein